MNLLVVNVGSSSVKLRVLDDRDEVTDRADLPAEPDPQEIADFLGAHPGVRAVAHRIVHGGSTYGHAVVVDDEVLDRLDELRVLAPLHNPPAVAQLRVARAALPDVPHVACFDTAFHATMPRHAVVYAIPAEWTDELGVRRYGFHGLSHAWAAHRVPQLVPRVGRRIVVCHLGAGASLAAVRDGACVDTTMGFTPVEGLVMATRSGDVDAGALFWVQERLGWTPAQMAHAVNHRSGLLGLSGTTADMEQLLALDGAGDPRARLAVDVYVHRLCKAVAAMAASAGGIDALVFTGGVGEHAAAIRSRACTGLRFLGVDIDPAANEQASSADLDLSAEGAGVRTLLVHAREELEMARQVRDVLGGTPIG